MTPDERTTLAGEYVLGLLEGDEAARARTLLAEDDSFRFEVGRWGGRLAPLLDEVEPIVPPRGGWEAIADRIGSAGEPASNVLAFRRRVTFWKTYSLAATAAAAALALFLVIDPRQIDPAPQAPDTPAQVQPAGDPMVAMLESEDTEARLIATWDPSAERLVLAAAAQPELGPDQSHELWAIPADGKPRSIGVLPQSGPAAIAVAGPLSRLIGEGVTLAISREPRGGSPTGAPTGPVVASGTLERA